MRNNDELRRVGSRIRLVRDWKGMTQSELAELIGVLANTVSRWEHGRCGPTGAAKKWLQRNWPEVYATTPIATPVRESKAA